MMNCGDYRPWATIGELVDYGLHSLVTYCIVYIQDAKKGNQPKFLFFFFRRGAMLYKANGQMNSLSVKS